MKFDINTWQEIAPNETHQAPKRLQLQCSEKAALYFRKGSGREVLAATGESFDVETQGGLSFRVHGQKALRVFMYVAPGSSVEHSGEVFTNLDRVPDEGGSISEVTRALRLLQLERRKFREDMRREAAVRRNKAKSEAKPEAEAKPEPEPEPQT